ncbi:hypothetical protein [Flectobacillus major]|jgi:Spy/CpxP family protein refolding chaperone|uniref:hypothetical protein n=1 Tax=Flectobacillus major TaxID=103 RepID=UPI0004039DB6|nr:hypothetical protein [Flectobacillus major]
MSKSAQRILFAFLCLGILTVSFDSLAQYGYGGGYGRQGGFGNRGGIPQAGQGETRRRDDGMDPEKIAEEDTRWMTKKLKLSEEQLPKVEDLNIKYAFQRFDLFEEIKKATNNGTMPPSDEVRVKIREKMQKMKVDKDNDMKAILTPEQYETYQKKRKD